MTHQSGLRHEGAALFGHRVDAIDYQVLIGDIGGPWGAQERDRRRHLLGRRTGSHRDGTFGAAGRGERAQAVVAFDLSVATLACSAWLVQAIVLYATSDGGQARAKSGQGR